MFGVQNGQVWWSTKTEGRASSKWEESKPIRPQKIEKKNWRGRIHKNVKNCGKDRVRTYTSRGWLSNKTKIAEILKKKTAKN